MKNKWGGGLDLVQPIYYHRKGREGLRRRSRSWGGEVAFFIRGEEGETTLKKIVTGNGPTVLGK